MVDLSISALIYLVGSLFMTMHFAPSEEGSPKRYMVFVFFWPFITIWMLLLDILGFGDDEEEEE